MCNFVDVLLVAVGGVYHHGELRVGAVAERSFLDPVAQLDVPGSFLGKFPVVGEVQFVGGGGLGGRSAGVAFGRGDLEGVVVRVVSALHDFWNVYY